MVDDATLANLRRLFAEELADHVTRLEQAAAALARATASAEIESSTRDVRRSAHTLKGSARVTGFAGIERLCDALETELAHAPDDASDAVLAPLRLALPALRDASHALAAGAPAPEGALREASAALRSRSQRATPSVVPAENPPLADIVPASEASPSDEPTPFDAGVAAHDYVETVRVSVANVAALLTAAQELHAITTRMRGVRRTSATATLEETRAHLVRAGRAARALASATEDDRVVRLASLVDTATESLSAVLASERARAVEQDRAWADAQQSATRITERSRALRVRRFGSLVSSIEAVAQETAAALGKRVSVVVDGAGVELDRRVLDGLREPLMHLVRNAVDHGIESPDARTRAGKTREGTLTVRATLSGVELMVSVEDDGAGIDLPLVRARAEELGLDPGTSDRDALATLFEPGFTTRRTSTPFSGRGVGLDVVRQRVVQLHGRVSVDARRGEGTWFRVVVPSDLSVLQGLIVRVRDAHVVLPTTTVERVVRAHRADLIVLDGRLHVPSPTGPVPVTDAADVLGFPARAATELDGARRPIAILGIGERRMALWLDAVVDERAVVVQPLGKRIRRVALVSGGVLLDSGELALLLDVGDLLRFSRAVPERPPAPARRVRHVLLVDDSVTTRQLERSLLEAAGYAVTTAVDGADAWAKLEIGGPFDAVVTDVEMPRVDGLTLLSRIRSTSRVSRLPVVLVTALTSDADRQRALDLGASAYITKRAFDDESLLDALDALGGR